MNNRKRFWLIFELAVILIGGSICLLRQNGILPSAGAALSSTAVIETVLQENSR